jgi:hypothetical protein
MGTLSELFSRGIFFFPFPKEAMKELFLFKGRHSFIAPRYSLAWLEAKAFPLFQPTPEIKLGAIQGRPVRHGSFHVACDG